MSIIYPVKSFLYMLIAQDKEDGWKRYNSNLCCLLLLRYYDDSTPNQLKRVVQLA